MTPHEAYLAALGLVGRHGTAVGPETMAYQSSDLVIHVGEHGMMIYDCASMEVLARA